ncbi:ABC transporter permease [Faecalicatena faecalis]|nr:ABC transporter permease [Faecalicatena faecalis]
MAGKGFTPNNNNFVIKMLSKEFGKSNRGRNRILLGAVILCTVTLTMVFGISYGKVRAECTKAARAAGTTASVCIRDADESQYAIVNGLGYVKQAGRRVSVGEAASGGEAVCQVQWLDENAWEKMMKPAYTGIHGEYPEKPQEIMLSKRTLKNLDIDNPEKGMLISLEVSMGLFETRQEEFQLSGWFTDYTDGASHAAPAYAAEAKLEDWGYDPDEKADILICQSDNINWQEAEEKLYTDVPMKSSGQAVSASNTFAYDAVSQLAGSYGMAALGAVVILSGMFFLLYNVMQISMAGDVRQLGLLNTIGTTRKQIRKIYYGQILRILVPGVCIGAFLSAGILLAVLPRILGKQYLNEYGGAKELVIFRPEILAASAIFVILLTMSVAAGVVHRVVNASCVETMHYTGLKIRKRAGKKADKGTGKDRKTKREKRSVRLELWYMAWQNLNRYRGRFLVTVLSLFLGVEAFLGVAVVTSGSDYAHVIEKRPDFLIAGQFSSWGQEMGYGSEYQSRDAGEDPMKTEGDAFTLLYGNDYDEFSPISPDVKTKLLNLDGVDQERSYIMEGAYMISTISRKGIRPMQSETAESQGEDAGAGEKEGVGYGYDSGFEMIEGFNQDVIQILSREEMADLKRYVTERKLPVDIKSLEQGRGVMILHDHQLTPAQEKLAQESVGEPVFFTGLLSKEERIRWNQMTPKERDAAVDKGEGNGKQSETFRISGYLDNQAEGFPHIRQTWHGSEGNIYYLISEEGFEKLPIQKKTLYMELNVEKEKEPQIKRDIQKIVSLENMSRAQAVGTDVDGGIGEAGIFYISKSDLLSEAAAYIRGTRLILGSISAVLLFAGLTNYFNVVITGILTRKKELEVMYNIGMTEKQMRKMFLIEGGYYCGLVGILTLTAGNGILRWISLYMETKLSYFDFQYPIGWELALLLGFAVICLVVTEAAVRGLKRSK